MASRVSVAWRWAAVGATTVLLIVQLRASDHADPIDIFNRKPLEGGITDLFVFPEGDHMMVIFCVRRALTQTQSLNLEPYTYAVHMDLHSTVSRDDDQNNKRYGGTVTTPEGIKPDVTFEFRLNNQAKLREPLAIRGLSGNHQINNWENGPIDRQRINVWTGVTDDPFIFPVFFGTNVVAMVMSIPMTAFPAEQRDWVIWGTSSRDGKQIDHVGRSLRTQNPRFELLNTLPPSAHVAAIREEHDNPSLMRDIFLRIGLNSTFAYRRWDQVPDVMIYTRQAPIRFPNGRLLPDDVAELLAVYGDTLLKEISYIAGGWPRATTNDKAFKRAFPYLADPWPEKDPSPPLSLSRRNKIKLIFIGLAVFLVPFFLGWLIAYLQYRRKFRLRYL